MSAGSNPAPLTTKIVGERYSIAHPFLYLCAHRSPPLHQFAPTHHPTPHPLHLCTCTCAPGALALALATLGHLHLRPRRTCTMGALVPNMTRVILSESVLGHTGVTRGERGQGGIYQARAQGGCLCTITTERRSASHRTSSTTDRRLPRADRRFWRSDGHRRPWLVDRRERSASHRTSEYSYIVHRHYDRCKGSVNPGYCSQCQRTRSSRLGGFRARRRALPIVALVQCGDQPLAATLHTFLPAGQRGGRSPERACPRLVRRGGGLVPRTDLYYLLRRTCSPPPLRGGPGFTRAADLHPGRTCAACGGELFWTCGGPTARPPLRGGLAPSLRLVAPAGRTCQANRLRNRGCPLSPWGVPAALRGGDPPGASDPLLLRLFAKLLARI